ncbi:MAG: transposase [Theionarchaea archaeon]|nr:transposase [Theionarchaea archaeon]
MVETKTTSANSPIGEREYKDFVPYIGTEKRKLKPKALRALVVREKRELERENESVKHRLFEIDWVDKRTALRKFCRSIKKYVYPSLEELFDVADYSWYSVDSLSDVLTYNAINEDTSENGTRTFGDEYDTDHPSPRLIRYRLGKLELDNVFDVFQEGNRKILSIVKKMRKLNVPLLVSIDITHTPFYGKRKKYTCGTKKFKGTNYGYRYASIVVSAAGYRFTIHTVPMTQFDTKTEMLEELITEARKHIEIRTVLVDREFFNVKCIEKLKSLNVKFLMPVVKNKKKFLMKLVPPCITEMSMGSRNNKTVFSVIAVRDPEDKKVILYYATNMDIPKKSVEQVIEEYKKRWTVENAFKTQKLRFLAKTYSINYTVRFFFWVFATWLYNLWVLCNLVAFLCLKLEPSEQIRPLVTAKKFGVLMKITFLSHLWGKG